MRIGIFCSRQTHHRYAKQLSQFLHTHSDDQVCIFWYKELRRHFLTPALLQPSPTKLIDHIVDDYMRGKLNTPEGIAGQLHGQTRLRWLKKLEAHVLYGCYRRAFKLSGIQHLLIWNGLKFRQRIAVAAAKDLGIPCLYLERGAFPGTTSLDPCGINYLNSVPRDPQFYRSLPPSDSRLPTLKYSNDRPTQLTEPYLFVPFQVNTDSQTLLMSTWIRTMFDLVEQLVNIKKQLGADIPQLVFKTHPACPQDYSELRQTLAAMEIDACFVEDVLTADLVAHSEAVITINSTTGLEALLAGKRVITLGLAYYNIDGLVLHADNSDALKVALCKLHQWQPDEQLRQRFLHHLLDEHVIDTHWKKADQHHLELLTQRLRQLTSRSTERSQP